MVGGLIVGDRNAKSHLSDLQVTESQFADDVARNSSSRQDFEAMHHQIVC